MTLPVTLADTPALPRAAEAAAAGPAGAEKGETAESGLAGSERHCVLHKTHPERVSGTVESRYPKLHRTPWVRRRPAGNGYEPATFCSYEQGVATPERGTRHPSSGRRGRFDDQCGTRSPVNTGMEGLTSHRLSSRRQSDENWRVLKSLGSLNVFVR